MATTGIKAMEIMATMVTVIKAMEDMVAMITLVTTTIMAMVTTTVSIVLRPVFFSTFETIQTCEISTLFTCADQSGGYGKSPRRGGHTNSYKPY